MDPPGKFMSVRRTNGLSWKIIKRLLLEKRTDIFENCLGGCFCGVIEPVPKPPTWVNPLVVVPKSNGDIRICVDMRRTNSSIIRELYQIPTLEEVLVEINGCTKFSKIDLNQG